MKSSWINSCLLVLGLLSPFSYVLAVQEESREEGLSEVDATLRQLEAVFGILRGFQPDRVLTDIEKRPLNDSLKNFFRGWAFHQKGEYEKASGHFEQVDSSDLSAEPFLLNRLEELAKTAEELKNFRKLETENFSIRYQAGPDEVLLLYLPELLEKIYASYSEMFHYTRDDRIIVEIMPDHRLFSYASALTKSQIETTGTIALCVENRLVVLTPRRVLQGYYWPDTIAHEFVHYILTKLSNDGVPLWMQEGVAKSFEARWERPNAEALDPGLETSLAKAIKKNEFLTVEDMMPSFAALPTAELARQAYAQTASMIDFMNKTISSDLVYQLTIGLRDDENIDRVMTAKLGYDFPTFEENWRTWAKQQPYKVHEDTAEMGVELLDEDLAEESIAELKEKGEADKKHLRLGDLLLERNRYQGALRQYEKTQKKGDRLSRQIVLRMLSCYKGLERNESILSLLAEHIPRLEDDSTMLLYRAEALTGLGRQPEARRDLERIVRINPFNPKVFQVLVSALDAVKEKQAHEKARKALEILSRPRQARPPKESKS